MLHWFYRLEGSNGQHGPIGPAELLELIRQGVIDEKTLVRKGNSAWVISTEIHGLWEAAGRPSAAFDCPQCGKPIAKPPVRCSHCHQFIQQAMGRLVHHRNVLPPSAKSQSTDGTTSKTSRFGTSPGLYD